MTKAAIQITAGTKRGGGSILPITDPSMMPIPRPLLSTIFRHGTGRKHRLNDYQDLWNVMSAALHSLFIIFLFIIFLFAVKENS